MEQATQIGSQLISQNQIVAFFFFFVLVILVVAGIVARIDLKSKWKDDREDRLAALRAENEYKASWLNTAKTQADRLEALVREFEDMRFDLNAVLMLLAKDRPELIEFFKARERRKGAS